MSDRFQIKYFRRTAEYILDLSEIHVTNVVSDNTKREIKGRR